MCCLLQIIHLWTFKLPPLRDLSRFCRRMSKGVKNATNKRKPTPLPTEVVLDNFDSDEMQPWVPPINTKLESMLNHMYDFKMLTDDEIEEISHLTSNEKIRVIMTYNKIMEAFQIMFADK